MASAFRKEVVRSITKSAGRFVAIAIISLLGAGFYAGLRMSAPDMRLAGDEFFDGCNLYDLSVVSTLGLDDENIQQLSAIEGVSQVMPAYRTDAMVLTDGGGYAANIESFPLESARSSESSDPERVVSSDDSYLNRLVLTQGDWPSDSNECVVSEQAAKSLGLEVGDSLAVDKTTGELDETLATTQFTISGFVNSAAFASTKMLGTTSFGKGTYDLYVYVAPSAFASDYPYSIAYLSLSAAKQLRWASDDYDNAVAEVKGRVESAAGSIGDARYVAVRSKAQSELDDARADYDEERSNAEQELSDGQANLVVARSKLDDASAKLVSSKEALDSAAAAISANEAKLLDSEQKYSQGMQELDAQRAAFEPQYAQLDSLKSQRRHLAEYIVCEQQEAAALQSRIEQAQASHASQAVIDALKAQLATVQEQIDQLEAQLAPLDEGIAQLEQGKAKLDAAQRQLDESRSQLDDGWRQLAAGKAQYASGLAQYEDGVAQYAQGEREYADGVAEYEDGKTEAARGFAEADKELSDAQAEINDIDQPEVFVLDRTKNVGAASLSSDANGIQQIATLLPFMFFLVAALVSLTSMTRMVDEERLEIGTHKALGYSRARITSKYLIYGVLASGIGGVIGVITFGKLFPWVIMTSYQVSYAIPNVPLPIDPWVTFKALGLSVGVTAIATWASAAASLRERPAALMLPKVPSAGKRIVLERVTPLWRRMSFSQKVTARNLLRYKRRFFMAVVGIAGCTALLVIGFGIRDAIGGVVENQFGSLVEYDVAIRVDDEISDEARGKVREVLRSDGVEGSLEASEFNMIARGRDGDMRIEVVVPEDGDRLRDFVVIRDRVTQEPIELGGESIAITEKAAETLGLSTGGSIELYDENDVGDAQGEGRGFTVGGIAENYLGHYAYMLSREYSETFGEAPVFNTVYVKLADGVDEQALRAELLAIDGVNTVSFKAEQARTYESMLNLMTGIIGMIIALSAALAFVVLYNLTNINISERVREIATLKVLGFTKGEVNAYIFREVIIMAFVGALVGCAIGGPLTFYISQAAETEQMMFGRVIWPISYVLSFVITMAFSVVVAFSMRHKLNRVNMVESLKSVE